MIEENKRNGIMEYIYMTCLVYVKDRDYSIYSKALDTTEAKMRELGYGEDDFEILANTAKSMTTYISELPFDNAFKRRKED